MYAAQAASTVMTMMVCMAWRQLGTEGLGQPTFAGLLVERRQVMAGLLHSLYHMVEAYAVVSVGERGIEIGSESTGGSKGIALYTRYLYQSADRVAGHAEMMLKSHLCRILYLCRTTSEELACSSTGHGTSYAHLALAAHVCAGDGGVVLDHIADESGCGQGMTYALVAEVVTA